MIRILKKDAEKVRRYFLRASVVGGLTFLVVAVLGTLVMAILGTPAKTAHLRAELLAQQAIRAERVARIVTDLLTPERLREQYEMRNALIDDLRDLRIAHRHLMAGSKEIGLPPPTDADFLAVMRAPGTGIDATLADLVNLVERRIISNEGRVDRETADQITWLVRGALAPGLEQMALKYADISRTRLGALLTIQIVAATSSAILGAIVWVIIQTWLARRVDGILFSAPGAEREALMRTVDRDSFLPNAQSIADRIAEEIAALPHDGGVALLAHVQVSGLEDLNAERDPYRSFAIQRALIERVSRLVRSGDSVAVLDPSRLAVLAGGLDGRERCDACLRALRDTFTGPVTIGSRSATLSAHVGATIFDRRARDAARLIGEAERAAFFAVRGGTGAINLYDPILTESKHAGEEMREELLAAMRDGQLSLRFQAVMGPTGVPTGELEAVPTLASPRHQPFLSCQLEEMIWAVGLSNEYVHWLAGSIAQALRTFDQAGVSVKSVIAKMPRCAVGEPAVFDSLLWGADAVDIAPQRVAVEIWGLDMARLGEKALSEGLARLGRAGFLLHYGVDPQVDFDLLAARGIAAPAALAISRAGIANVDSDPQRRSWVSAAMRHARKWEIDIRAKDVETETEKRALERIGIGRMQGHAFAAPQPVAAYLPLPKLRRPAPRKSGPIRKESPGG